MSLQDNTPPAAAPHPPALRAAPPHDPPARLAHELANLLDGSMRNVNLMMSSLRLASDNLDAADEDMLRRLSVVNTAMQQMGTLIQRWMSRNHDGPSIYNQPHTLEQTVNHVRGLMAATALAHGIDIDMNLSSEVAELPAGPLYPVFTNAIRNSIESIARKTVAGDRTGGFVRIVGRVESGNVVIHIYDSGAGVDERLLDEQGRFRFGQTNKATGHGLGLSLGLDIARSLGGELTLENSDTGAVLTLTFPLRKGG